MAEVRICGKCQRVCGPHQPDPCLGDIPGVMGACCGHGDPERAFIGWKNGLTIRGFWIDEESREKNIENIEWERLQWAEYVVIIIPMVRETLHDDANFDDEALRSLGQMCVEVARDQYERENFLPLRPVDLS